MLRKVLVGTLLSGVAVLLSSVPATAQEYFAKFSGFQEVGGLGAGETGAILSPGQATLKLDLDKGAQTLTFTLTYSGLANVLQSHIHFGKEHVAGGIMVFFCTNLGNGPAGTQACPDDSGGPITITGTITAADVQAIAGQNVPAGDFNAVISALTSDSAYANIHTKLFPSGEIRGQVHGHHNFRGRDGGDRNGDNRNRDNRDNGR